MNSSDEDDIDSIFAQMTEGLTLRLPSDSIEDLSEFTNDELMIRLRDLTQEIKDKHPSLLFPAQGDDLVEALRVVLTELRRRGISET